MHLKTYFLCIPSVLVACTLASVNAADSQRAVEGENAIAASLSGPLTVRAIPRCPGTRSGLWDDSAWKLTAAQVFVGGNYVSLDWGDNQEIRDEILSRRLPSSLSDYRMPMAKVTGRMTFQRLGVIQGALKKVGGGIYVPVGADNDTLIPVLEVESLTVELGWPKQELDKILQFENRIFLKGRGTEQTDEREPE